MHKGVQTTAGCVVCGSVPPLRGEQCRPCLVLCVLSGEEGCDKVPLLLSEALPGSTWPSHFSLLLPFFSSPSPTVKKWSLKSNIDFFFWILGAPAGINGNFWDDRKRLRGKENHSWKKKQIFRIKLFESNPAHRSGVVLDIKLH